MTVWRQRWLEAFRLSVAESKDFRCPPIGGVPARKVRVRFRRHTARMELPDDPGFEAWQDSLRRQEGDRSLLGAG